MDEIAADMLADEARAQLAPQWLPVFAEALEMFVRDPERPLDPWERSDDPPIRRCSVLTALGETMTAQLATGAVGDAMDLLDYVEGLLVRYPATPVREWDDSIWNGVGVCFFEALFPVEEAHVDLVQASLGPNLRSIVDRLPWMLEIQRG